MKLIECTTCGSHEFNGNKCAYCGNEYEVQGRKDFMKELKIDPLSDYMANLTPEETREIYSNLKDGLTPNQIRIATCKEELINDAEPFVQSEIGQKILKVMIWILVSIIWFAITIFIPPLFLVTVCGLIILSCKWLIKKRRK